MSISVSYNPTPTTPLGFTARVSPAWGGDAMSGAEPLWGRESMGGMSHDPMMSSGGNRLDTEVGYGLPIGSRFVGTPRAGVRTSEYGRDYRIGYGMQVLEQGKLNLELGIDAERRESPLFRMHEQGTGSDQRVLGRATVQWYHGRTSGVDTTDPPGPGTGRPKQRPGPGPTTSAGGRRRAPVGRYRLGTGAIVRLKRFGTNDSRLAADARRRRTKRPNTARAYRQLRTSPRLRGRRRSSRPPGHRPPHITSHLRPRTRKTRRLDRDTLRLPRSRGRVNACGLTS